MRIGQEAYKFASYDDEKEVCYLTKAVEKKNDDEPKSLVIIERGAILAKTTNGIIISLYDGDIKMSKINDKGVKTDM